MCKCIKKSGNKIYFCSGNKVTIANCLHSWGSCLIWLDSAIAEPKLAALSCTGVCDSALQHTSSLLCWLRNIVIPVLISGMNETLRLLH